VASTPLILQATDLVWRALHERTAQNVELDAVTVTGEGPEVGILLIPHRDLGGYSLVVWVTRSRISLSWGGVRDLSYHDDIDLAKPAFEMDGPGWANNAVVRAALAAEMRRPIRITVRRTRIRRRWQLWCAVELSGQLAPSFVQDVFAPSMSSKDRILEIGTTSLEGPERPPIRWPVPLVAWRRWADSAWPLES
jgi:hypothetical protein